MNFLKKIQIYWDYIEKKYPKPKYVKNIIKIDIDELKSAINKKNFSFIKKVIRNLHKDSSVIILGNAAPKDLKKTIFDLVNTYENKKPTFYKMFNGVKNFYRIIDKKVAYKYSTYAIKQSYYFFNWNCKSKTQRKFQSDVYNFWRYTKLLAGISKRKYEKNIPSDNKIDRIQIVKYPKGGGEIKDHIDNVKNLRVTSGLVMSKKGVDFKSGGIYFRDKKNKKVFVENKINDGDAVIFCGSIVHGVSKVDPKKRINWKSKNARWYVGMFVEDSDYVKNRNTATNVTKANY